jgi:hypothetical protein
MTSGLIGVGKVADGKRLAMFESRGQAQNFAQLFNRRLALREGIQATVVLGGPTEQPGQQTSAPEEVKDKLQALNARIDTLVGMFQQQASKQSGQQPAYKQPALSQENSEGKGAAGKPASKKNRKRGLCYGFLEKGQCRFGAKCRFRHEQRATDPEEKKKGFEKIIAEAKEKKAKYSDPQTQSGDAQVCRFYELRRCQFGDKCHYSHEDCNDFVAGRCNRGRLCKFAHRQPP